MKNLSPSDFKVGLPNDYKMTGDLSLPKVKTEVQSVSAKQSSARLYDARDKALRLASIEIKSALDAAMRASAWGQNDNIVDTGELMNSLTVTVEDDGLKISYSAPYAALVHYGGYITPYGNVKLDKVYVPARPWAEAVIYGGGPVEKYDFAEVFLRVMGNSF